MDTPVLIIISGPPGAGKTTLGRRLAADLRWPFVNKDDIKERLFGTLGWEDRAWSRRLGVASADLLMYFTEVELMVGRSLVVENAFWKDLAAEALRALRSQYPYHPMQIHCRADIQTLIHRYTERTLSGARHPGHDNVDIDELRQAISVDRYGALDIGGELIELDTTKPERIEYDTLLTEIRGVVEHGHRCV